MSEFIKRYGIAVIALVIAVVVFLAGFACGASARGNERATAPTATRTTASTTAETSGTETTAPTAEVPVYTEYELAATAYCPCEKCCGVWATKRPLDDCGKPIVYTASGTVAEQGRTVAADTTVFPFGTVLIINGIEYVVEDRGGAIKGNRIDIYFNDHEEALQFGRQKVVALVKVG